MHADKAKYQNLEYLNPQKQKRAASATENVSGGVRSYRFLRLASYMERDAKRTGNGALEED